MLRRIRTRAALQVVILGVMVLGMLAPSAFASYRCRVMGMTMAAPCCGDHADPHGSDGAKVRGERCCSQVTLAATSAPSEIAPQADGELAPTDGVVVAVAPPLPAPAPPASTHVLDDPGPPILARSCALLI